LTIYSLKLLVYDSDPQRAQEMNNFIISELQRIITEVNIGKAKHTREFLENRYTEVINELKISEDNFADFQKNTGLLSAQDQLKAVVNTVSDLSYEILKMEIESEILKINYGQKNSLYLENYQKLSTLKKKKKEIYEGNNLDNNSLQIPIKELPDLAIKFLRMQREVEIRSKLIEFLLPQLEQAKIQEQKSIPTFSILDPGFAPDRKYKPKRLYIVIGGFMFSLIFSWVYVFSNEYYTRIKNNDTETYKKIIYIKNSFKGNLFGYKK